MRSNPPEEDFAPNASSARRAANTAPNEAPDQNQRRAALDIGRSCIVEAPAGSGKTGLLVQRFLKLLGYADIDQPEQVLAITFARDATAEIRNRIGEALELAAAPAQTGSPLIEPGDDFGRETLELAKAVLARSEERQWHLLDRPQRINVRSIDAVCADIVSHLPVLSLAGSRLSPVEDARPLYEEAALRLLKSLGIHDSAVSDSGSPDPPSLVAASPSSLTGSLSASLPDALETLLLHRDGNLADCQALLAEMLAWRDQWGRLVPLDGDLGDERLERDVKPKLERTLQHAICKALEQVRKLFPPEDLQQLARLTHGAAQVLDAQQMDGAEPSHLGQWLRREHVPDCTHDELEAWRALAQQLLTGGGEWRKPGGVNKNLGYPARSAAKAAKQALLSRLAENEPLRLVLGEVSCLPDALYPAEQWRVAKALFRLLKWGIVELKLLFAETGQCDFSEISLAAQHALGQQSGLEDLAVSMGTRLRHLLVDEMQDTSISQYGLLRSLTASWDGHSQTVFLVGDPKQSIYLFRQARVELFEQTARHGLGDIQLDRLRLSANFRSQAALVKQFNEDFARIFPAEAEAADDVPYAHAHPVRAWAASGVAWHVETYTGAARSPEATEGLKLARQKEAASIVQLLELHHGREKQGGAPQRIAVLVRARAHLHLIASELRKHGGIPFRAVEIEALNEQQEVLDVLSLTRALLHPADRVAWLSILRAPWCGLTLGELQLLTGSDDPHSANMVAAHLPMTRLIEDNAPRLPGKSRERLSRVGRVMQAAESQRGRLPLSQWVERAWHSLGGPFCVGPEQNANVETYLRLLDKCEQEALNVDAAVLAQRIEKLYATPQAQDQHAVELLTMHGAKGLEWDVVVVPGLERKPGIGSPPMLAWMEIPGDAPGSKPLPMLVPVAAKGEQNSRLSEWLKGLRSKRESAEYKRLYYVACTRAREELHLFASSSKGESGWALNAGSLLATAWKIAEPHFENKAVEVERQVASAPLMGSMLLQMPSGATQGREPGLLTSLAATAAADGVETTAPQAEQNAMGTSRAAPLRRLPLGFDPAYHGWPSGLKSLLRSHATPQALDSFDAVSASLMPGAISRPEGSLAARALGKTVHTFLEKLAFHFASGGTLAEATSLPRRWSHRIAAVLRSYGLSSPRTSQTLAVALAALKNALEDSQGQWILAAHRDALSEAALQGWSGAGDSSSEEWDSTGSNSGAQSFSVRLDRVFRAGASPLSDATAGEDFLWVVDYKTAAHDEAGVETFLDRQKEIYQPKMESYAQALRLLHGDGTAINLALYYPLLRKLVWWRS